MATLQDWAEDVNRDIPEPLFEVIARHTSYVVQDFFRRSEAWRHVEQFNVLEGVDKYLLVLTPSDTYPRATVNAYVTDVNGNRTKLVSTLWHRIKFDASNCPRYYALKDGEIYIDGTTDLGVLDVEVILQPTRNIEEIPDEVADMWYDDIRNGVISRVLLMPRRDWTDIGSAKNYGMLYQEGLESAKREARNDRSRPKRTVRFNQSFGW